MNWFFRIVAAAAILASVAAYAQSQLFCEAGATTPPATARAEGTTELIGDMLVVCTGGTPTPAGQPVPVVNVTLSLNTNITNRLLGAGFMDALLLIDEPYPSTPIVPQNTGVSTDFNPAQALCYSTAIAAPGSCNYLPGNGGGGYQYSSSPYLQPNAFTIYAAQQNAANQVTWYGVPIDPPGNDLRVIHMTNLRANANLIGAHVTSADIVATVGFSDTSDTILYSQQTVASTVTGMRFNNPPVTLCGCVSHNASLLGGSGTPAFDGSIQVIEIFANSMRRRNIGLTVDGPTPPLAYPQNVPSFAYPYETGFLPSPVAVSPPGYTLEPADSGARFVLSFSNVPAGVQVFLPVSVTVPVEIPSSGYPPGTGIYEPQIQLVQAQPNGFSGPAYTAIPSTATIGTTPVAQASRIGTTVFATYEVVNVETAEADTFNIRFALAFNGSTPQSGTIVPLASLAPISTTGVATTNSEPVPRFVPTNFTPPPTLGDFDNNGVPDRVWQNDTTGQATVHYAGYAGVDLGSFNWLNTSVLPTWRIVAVADFNNDGIPDLIWQDSVTREVTVHYYGGAGGALQQSWKWLQSAPVPGWTVVAAADFNSDGVPDLVWQNDTTRQVVVHYYGGASGAVYQGWNWLQQTAIPGWHVVGAADFNSDGVPDLVWQNDTTGQVAVHYYGGSGGAVYQTSAPLNNNADAPSGWIVEAVSDVNGDGVPDLLWQNTSTHQVTVNYYGGPGGASIIGWNWISEPGAPGWSVVH